MHRTIAMIKSPTSILISFHSKLLNCRSHNRSRLPKNPRCSLLRLYHSSTRSTRTEARRAKSHRCRSLRDIHPTSPGSISTNTKIWARLALTWADIRTLTKRRPSLGKARRSNRRRRRERTSLWRCAGRRWCGRRNDWNVRRRLKIRYEDYQFYSHYETAINSAVNV